jgi:lysine/ornithine N-monooxygenase
MADKPHFFISRAGEDAEYAKWVAGVLEAERYTTTLQDLDFRPGNSFAHQMSQAQKRADHVIALLSPHYVAKQFTVDELYTVFVKDPLGEARCLIPVRIAPCESPT